MDKQGNSMCVLSVGSAHAESNSYWLSSKACTVITIGQWKS